MLLKINPELSLSEQAELKTLLHSYADVFSFSSTELGRYTGPCPLGEKVKIHAGEHPPIHIRPFRHSMTENKKIDDEVQKLLSMNIIRRSDSSWFAPVLLVKRKDEADLPRLCVSYVA